MIVYNNQAPNNVNNVGQFGATEGSIGAYKQAAEYAADAKYWALLSQTKYNSVEDILAEVERLYSQGLLLEEDIKQLKIDFEAQQQDLLGLIQSTNTAIDNTNSATELSKEATQEVLAQLDIISNMTVQTTLLPPGSMATGSYDNSTGVFSFGIPEGQPGRDGTDGTISDIGNVPVGKPATDDYGFYVDKIDGGLYRADMSDIANLVPSVRSVSINGGAEQMGAVAFNSVSSFNARTGDVVSQVGDYEVSQITGAASSGANSDITSLSGLTTALSVSQGGTGATTAEESRTNLGLGSVSVEDIVPLTKGGTGATTAGAARTSLGLGLVSTESIVPITKGGTGATSAENARLALVAAKSGDNSDITSMTNSVTFTQPVSVADAVDATNAVNLGQISSDQGASLIGTLEGVPVQNIISNINTDIIQLKLNWAIENGYSDAGFTFTTGGTLTVDDRDKVVYDPVSKTWYSYAGTLPVTVPASFNPIGNADWKPQTDPNLRTDLAAVGGASLIGAPRGVGTLAQYLDRMFIFIDDLPGVDGTGATDSAAGLNTALATYSGTGVEFVGKPTSTYLLESTVSFIGLSNITLNFNGGVVKDNVQGFIPDNGNRANHTFVIYNASNIHLQGFRYQQVSTRANRVPMGGPNTCMIWVGGQYLGGAMTRDIKVTNIYNLENNACDDGFFLCGMGELDNLLVEDIYLKGGNWNWGVNFEYGLAPENPATNQTMANGRHPYNITVRNMRGENLTSCDGFLRVGGAYNVMFEQCTGYNVTNFIHYFSGDRGVTRFGQNVYYKNCKAKHDPSVVRVTDNMVWIIVTDHDGSTGDPLPAWTNRYHEILFDNCEFWNNGALNGSCVRFVSNAGKTTFRNCTLKGGFYGVWAQPGGRATEKPRYSLTVQNCVIQNCFQFFRGVNVQGSKIDHCTFIGRQQGTTVETRVPAIVLSGDCSGTVFSDNLFTGANGISETNWFNNQSAEVTLERNKFEPALTADYPIASTYTIKGRGNTSTSVYLIDPAASAYRLVDEPVISKNLADVSDTVVDFDKGAIWTIGATKTVNSITGGKPGDKVIFNPLAGAANVTFEFGTVTGENRIVPRTVATEVKTGTGWSKTFVKMAGSQGWWEIS